MEELKENDLKEIGSKYSRLLKPMMTVDFADQQSTSEIANNLAQILSNESNISLIRGKFIKLLQQSDSSNDIAEILFRWYSELGSLGTKGFEKIRTFIISEIKSEFDVEPQKYNFALKIYRLIAPCDLALFLGVYPIEDHIIPKIQEYLEGQEYSGKPASIAQIVKKFGITDAFIYVRNDKSKHREFLESLCEKDYETLAQEYAKALNVNLDILNEVKKEPIRSLTETLYHSQNFGPKNECQMTNIAGTYLNLRDLGSPKIFWVAQINNDVLNTFKNLLSAGTIAYDTEWKPGRSVVSLLQVATKDEVYLFDVLRLRKSIFFHQFLVKLFGSPQVVKIVHDGNDDIENLSASLLDVVDKDFKIEIKGRISLAEIFKSKHQSKYSNLAFICKTIFNKELSKAEQLSDWEDRPLIESQLHYAALDCFILLQAFQILNSQTKVISLM